jgi:outer membrane protein
VAADRLIAPWPGFAVQNASAGGVARPLHIGASIVKRNIALILTTVALALGVTAVQAEDKPRVGYVDVRKVLFESTSGKRSQESMQRLEKEKLAVLEREKAKLDAEIQTLRADLEKNKLIYSQKQVQDKQQVFQEKVQRFQVMQQEARSELNKKGTELTKTSLENIRKIIAEVAKEQKLMLVFDLNTPPLYAEPGPDLTEKVMAQYNKKHPN